MYKPFCKPHCLYLHLSHLVGQLMFLSVTFSMFDLQLLKLDFDFLTTLFRFSFALCQSLQLDLQVLHLTLQGLLGFLHGYLGLRRRGDKLLMTCKCLLNTFPPYHCIHYLLGLFQLFIEPFKCLIVFLSHLSHLLLVELGLFIQGLLQLDDFCLTLCPEKIVQQCEKRNKRHKKKKQILTILL